MKKILTALSIIAVLASCQKEIDFGTDNPGNTGGSGGSGSGGGSGSTSGLLVKTVAVTGSETVTTLYTYDSQKRLETMTMTGMSGGMPADNYVKFFRDASGRIIKKQQKLADFAGATTDTAVQLFYYPNSTSLDYTYTVNTFSTDFGGLQMTSKDSSVFTYSGGKMTSFSGYLTTTAFGLPLPGGSLSRTDFGYDASNRVTSMKAYNDQGTGTLSLIADYTYTYASTSVNNLYYTNSGAQNFALNGLPNTGASIISKMHTVSSATTPPLDMTLTTTFVNGANNVPVTATAVAVTTGQPTQTTNYTFFYQ